MAFLNIEIRPYFFLFTGSHLARKERYTIAYDQHVHYRSGSARTSISCRSFLCDSREVGTESAVKCFSDKTLTLSVLAEIASAVEDFRKQSARLPWTRLASPHELLTSRPGKIGCVCAIKGILMDNQDCMAEVRSEALTVLPFPPRPPDWQALDFSSYFLPSRFRGGRGRGRGFNQQN